MSVVGGRLKLKGDKPKKSKKKKRDRDGADDDDDDRDDDDLAALAASASTDPVAGEGKLTTSGVVVMGIGTDFAGALAVGDSLHVTVSDRFRNTQEDETRVVNMVLGKTSLNLHAPFSCDLTSPTSFMIIKRAPDLDALRAARAAERKRAKRAEEEASLVTYKTIKPGSGTWKTWQVVTEKVDAGTTREDMLRRRESEKADRYCK
jgi:hypothetical protein